MIDKENALNLWIFLAKEVLNKKLSDKDKELIHPILKSTKRNFKTTSYLVWTAIKRLLNGH
jgi:hypothetical protein